jgi:hypothetical protein
MVTSRITLKQVSVSHSVFTSLANALWLILVAPHSFRGKYKLSDFNSLSRKGSVWFRLLCASLGLLFRQLFLRNKSSKTAAGTSFKKWFITTPHPAENGIKQLENPLLPA